MSTAKKYFRVFIASLIKAVFVLGKIIAFLSVLFICTMAFSFAAYLVTSESFDSGESPGRNFFVAVATTHAGKSFELVPFDQASHSESSFILPQSDLVVRTGEYETIRYRVIEKTLEAATIETVRADGDYVFTSRYRVEGHRIVPLRLRILDPGDGMAGFFLALVFCTLLFYVLGQRFSTKINSWMSWAIEAAVARDLKRR